MTKEDILRRLREKKPQLMRKYPLHRLSLFGSWARGDQSEMSDVDILADVDPSIGLGFVSLADDLEKLLGMKVDLVTPRALKPALRKEITKDLVDA
ncbi:MAG TPA: nucleotidyltransferase family protein [Chitinivibrionales bacterium]|nr:nucleotidyltransferase family protein [Chitinivibrionales bacterium]